MPRFAMTADHAFAAAASEAAATGSPRFVLVRTFDRRAHVQEWHPGSWIVPCFRIDPNGSRVAC